MQEIVGSISGLGRCPGEGNYPYSWHWHSESLEPAVKYSTVRDQDSGPVHKSIAAAKSLQSCLTLCSPIDGSPPGSPVPGILQARTLDWVATSFSNACKWKAKVKSLSHVRLFTDHMDCSPSGSSIHGIFQARVLEWSAIAFSGPHYSHTHLVSASEVSHHRLCL